MYVHDLHISKDVKTTDKSFFLTKQQQKLHKIERILCISNECSIHNFEIIGNNKIISTYQEKRTEIMNKDEEVILGIFQVYGINEITIELYEER